MKKIILLISLYLISVLLLQGCKKQEKAVVFQEDNQTTNNQVKEIIPYGDALSTGEIAEPINLIPALASDSASHNVTQYIYNGLVKYDKDLNLVGDLAERWEISDDKKVFTFYLKKGVKWHDGVEFTADDVKFTYEFMISDDTPTAYDGDFRAVESVEVVDKYTVKVTYKEALSPALASWGIWMMPRHALKDKPSKSPLQRKPIGTGPYKLESWKPGQSITLTAFHDYFEGRPKIEKIFIRVIPNQTTQFLELLNGSIDIMGLNPKQEKFDTNTPRYIENYNTYSFLDFSYTYIGYNFKLEPFNNKLVRRALTHAIDKQSMVDGLLYGKGYAAEGPYKPDSYWYNQNAKGPEYNKEKAKALLKEAGFEDIDNDGFLEYKGKKFTIELMTNLNNEVRSKIAELVQHSWAEVGIKTQIKVLEWATMLGDLNKGNFQAVILGWSTVLDPDQYDIWATERCGGNGQNFICYSNEEVDRLLTEGRKVFNKEERRVYYDKVQEILADEQPYTFLYFPYSHIALNKRFQNVEPARAGITYNFIDWYVPKEYQKYKVIEE
ncbi:MAG: peptide-binding protein [Candidatus Mucispirillum faecigallinarum]|nr:peptide-binding protein [Candidatus Mucispirillum faecigallinarum]